jgi:hypothetical protein
LPAGHIAKDRTVIDIRSIVGLLAGALVASAAHAQSSATQPPEPKPKPKPANAAKQAAPRSDTIDIKRDARQAWSEMRRIPQEVGKGVPAAGREAGKTFQGGWNKAKEGFTGNVPPTIPDPPK